MGHKAGEYNDPTEDLSSPAGTAHTDPVAKATNPTEISSGSASAGKAPGTARSGASSLDETDAAYWRTTHPTAAYAKKDVEFDDYAPAYGFGHEVSRQNASAVEGERVQSIDQIDDHLRSGWEQVRGSSKLSYDEAKPAIAEAYNRSLRLHEERLNVTKDRVETGDVSIRKEIITEQKTIEVPVEREEVVITTRSLTGEADGATIGDGQTIRVPISEERVNIDKQVVATGEVRLDKKTIAGVKTVVDNVRKETVKIDKTGDVKVNEEVAKD